MVGYGKTRRCRQSGCKHDRRVSATDCRRFCSPYLFYRSVYIARKCGLFCGLLARYITFSKHSPVQDSHSPAPACFSLRKPSEARETGTQFTDSVFHVRFIGTASENDEKSAPCWGYTIYCSRQLSCRPEAEAKSRRRRGVTDIGCLVRLLDDTVPKVNNTLTTCACLALSSCQYTADEMERVLEAGRSKDTSCFSYSFQFS